MLAGIDTCPPEATGGGDRGGGAFEDGDDEQPPAASSAASARGGTVSVRDTTGGFPVETDVKQVVRVTTIPVTTSNPP